MKGDGWGVVAVCRRESICTVWKTVNICPMLYSLLYFNTQALDYSCFRTESDLVVVYIQANVAIGSSIRNMHFAEVHIVAKINIPPRCF